MTDRPSYTIRGLAGARSVSVEDTATRVRASFEAMTAVGEPLSGPWNVHYRERIDVTDEEALRAHVLASPVKDDYGKPSPEEGFLPQFMLGNFDVPHTLVKDTATYRVSMPPLVTYAPMGSSFSLTFEGEKLAGLAREHARALVEGFVRAWQPDSLVFADTALGLLCSDRLYGMVGPSLPSWGYVAWMSDVVSRQLEYVDGATTERFGPGTLIITDTWVPEQAAMVWNDLIDSKRLRGASEVQERLPVFP